MTARDEILGRIRDASAIRPAAEAPLHAPAYRTQWDAPRQEIVARFIQRLSDYHVTVLHCADGI